MRIIGNTAIRNEDLKLDDEATVQLAQAVLDYFTKQKGDFYFECVLYWSVIGRATRPTGHIEKAASMRKSMPGSSKELTTDGLWEL